MPGQEPRAAVRFGQLEHRGVLLGLTGVQLALVGAALLVATAALYAAGARGFLGTAPLWALLATAGTGRVGGRSITAWAPVAVGWQARVRTGRTQRLRSVGPAPASRLEVPGVAGTLEVAEGPETGAALVWDRRAAAAAAIARVGGSGFVLEDSGAQDYKVATWSRVLAELCQQPSLVRVQVVVRTLPTSANAARAWWRSQGSEGAAVPSRVLADLLDRADRDAVRHETLVVLAIRPPRGGRHLGPEDVAALDADLAAFADALAAADVPVARWVDAASLPAVLASSYDPTAPEPGRTSQVSVAAMGVAEAWDHVRTDTAVHQTFWVSEWPRTDVAPTFLQPLVLGPAWRTVSLIAEPMSTARALREIRRAHVEHAADAARRARVGIVEDEAVRAERADLAAREAELVAGHGDLRFTGLITVTARDVPAVAEAARAMRSTAAQAFVDVRPLVGQQAAAHLACAVPLARGVR